MSIKLKAKCIKCNFKKDDFRIFNWSPISDYGSLTLSNYLTFSSKGEDSYIDEGKEYELEIEEISCDKKFGSCVRIISVPSMNELDLDTLTRDKSFEILMDCTSSQRIANNILDAYEDFIKIILTDGKEAIDTNKIKGVGETYLNAYARNLTEKYKYYAMIQKYKDYNITVSDCKALLSEFSNDINISKEIKENPYKCLISVLNRSFEKTDNLLIELRPDLKESEQRCAYLILSVIERNELSGSTRLNGNDLYCYIMNEYNVPELEPLIVKVAMENELFFYDEESKDLSTATTYNGECLINNFVKDKIKNSTHLDIDYTKYTTIDDFTMSKKQAKALELFCKYNFMILCGFSGSGKTTSLRGIVKLMEDNGLSYTLVSPSGKASMRMTEALNRPASTIHRKCLRDGSINSDVLIVDESSMVGLPTFVMMLNCIENENIRVVLVGDNAQLSPVGIGRVFYDLIESNKVPMVMLDEVFRYKSNGSLFVATNIRQGKQFFNDETMVKHNGNEYKICDNYKFIETEDIFDEVLKQYNNLLSKGVKAKDMLCLSPQNVGEIGSYAINNAIQAEVNPPKPNENTMQRKIGYTNIIFRVGDLVINKKNDYKALPLESYEEIQSSDGALSEDDVNLTSVFNGQCGVVRKIEDKIMVIQFDEELIVFNNSKIDNLLLAYCISVHSSQGSEAQYVINIVSDKHSRMLSRNLLYVADTRSKKKTIDIGSTSAFNDALLIEENHERDTWLKELLVNE